MSARPEAGGDSEDREPPDGPSLDGAEGAASEDGGGAGEELARPLPEAVRARVVEYGSDVLGGMRPSELPPLLRRVARFEPRRRARLAGPQIAAQLESDDVFRSMVAERVEQVWPELAEGLRSGVVPPAADPVAVAACAYLLRPPGWTEIVEDVQARLPGHGPVTLDFAIVARATGAPQWLPQAGYTRGIPPGQAGVRGSGTQFCVSGPFPDTLPDLTTPDPDDVAATTIENLLNGVVVAFSGVYGNAGGRDVGVWESRLRAIPLYPPEAE